MKNIGTKYILKCCLNGEGEIVSKSSSIIETNSLNGNSVPKSLEKQMVKR